MAEIEVTEPDSSSIQAIPQGGDERLTIHSGIDRAPRAGNSSGARKASITEPLLMDLDDPDTVMLKHKTEIPPQKQPIYKLYFTRLLALVSLLMLQSISSFILSQYEELLENNIELSLYLTMLIGAGGNAGNQVAIDCIRGIATGDIAVPWDKSPKLVTDGISIRRLFARELTVGILQAMSLMLFGFVRVYAFEREFKISLSIATSLLFIVLCAFFVGASLPLLFHFIGVDAAHAGPTVQVFMDIIGVALVAVIATWLLGEGECSPNPRCCLCMEDEPVSPNFLLL